MSAGFVAAAIARSDQSKSDGIHVLWAPPLTAGWSIDGWDVQRRKSAGRPEIRCQQLTAFELQALHRILRLQLALGEIRLRQADCPGAMEAVPGAPQDRPEPRPSAGPAAGAAAPAGVGSATTAAGARGAGGAATTAGAAASATPFPAGLLAGAVAAVGTSTGPRRCAAYDIRLTRRHRYVQVRAGLPAALAIALREGKAVDARVLSDPSGTQTARFENRDVDEVLLYCAVAATSLEICLDQAPDPAKDEAAWAAAEFVAKGLQLPLRTLDQALGSEQDERDLAKSRLFSDEQFDEESFDSLAALMNAVGADAKEAAPVWSSTITREEPDDPFVELRTWSYALALLVDPAWRRMLGFAVLDKGSELDPGALYDYRVSGRFYRRDVEERVHGFHAVPRATTLPRSFALGQIALRTRVPAIVEQRPEPAAGSLEASGRKGIALAGDPCLTITFPTAVRSVVLELDGAHSLTFKARTTDYFPGLPVTTFGGAVPPQRRVTLEFAEPIDTLRLSGTGFLYAIRDVLSPAGTKPDDVVSRSVVLNDVPFVDAGLPAAPLQLGTVNLQQPLLPAPPGTSPPPASLGFGLHWTPAPPPAAPGPVPWPADANAAPPFEANGFSIERRRVDTNGDFEPIDGKDARTLAFGSRGAAGDPAPLGAGVDLELAFPENAAATQPVAPYMSLDDVLVKADGSGPPPGSLHQYRIFALDALGRPSATPRDGSVVRLEKRQPPPQPPGPPRDPDAVVPAGVRARVLQKLDPDLATDDRALLGSSDNAVVLEWGWTQAERDRDPHATEFRVYWQPLAPDVVSGSVTGPPALAGALFEMPATLDRPIAQDVMAGRYLSLPDHPFKVASHTAGQSIVVRLERSAIDAQRTPAEADFDFRPTLNGFEQRPPAWAERRAVVPIAAAESYRHVFRDRLTLDAQHPRARVWAGVSAADAQAYVDDALPAGVLNGGRPGNESAIATSDASARFLGRPQFTVPPPLPDVPEIVVDEPAGDGVLAVVDLPALLSSVTIPSGHLVQLDRIALDDVVGCMGANANGTIGAKLPGGAASSYTLGNPTDQADLIEQIRAGVPAAVENRFLMDFVLRFGGQLEPLWLQALPAPVAFGALTDTLPPKAGRWVHRIRIADPAGHLSAGAAIPAQVVRVPSLRSPSPPSLSATPAPGARLRVEARVREAFDVSWVLLFATEEDALATANGNLREAAQLLRLPNARDRYPDDGVRLRLADATLLAPAFVLDASAGTVDPPDRVLTQSLAPGPDRRVALWGVAMTRDGVTSRFAGPLVVTTGPAPLVAPALTVKRVGGTDFASWPAPDPPALLALERSRDGSRSFEQVSPWLPAGILEYALPAAGGGTVRYRLALRADRGRGETGEAVRPGR